MKPILFAANATTFTSNGLGSLDPTKCVVTEERNGQYEMECVVPTESAHFADIHNNMILVVIPGDGMTVHAASQRQAFRIYHITEPMNGLVTINARHISYDLSYNTVMPFTADGILTAFSGIVSHMVETNPFSFNTDKSTAASFKVSVPQTARQLLGGQAGSILDVYGGEYQWDNWTVDLWSQRGTDSSVTLRYGKNITDISQEENLENVVTGIVPFWAGEDSVVTLPEKSVDSAYASSYPYKRTVPVDFSSEWEDAPDATKLRNRANAYITANKIGVPKVSIKVSFVALWQTDEYKSIAPLERVHLCDTVGVVFEKYGINTRAEVIKTEWDCLAERYLSIELGDARSNFARTIVDMNDQTQQEIVEAKTDMQKAIDAATQWLTNGDGYVVAVQDANGNWKETLYMDTDDVTTATNVLRINMNGIGFSHDGINGPYVSAWTIAGAFNADFITAGTMSAARIKGGVLTLGGANNGNGVLQVKNASNAVISTIDRTGFYYGNNRFKVDVDGYATMTGATINGGSISYTNGKFGVDIGGNMTAQDATLTNANVSGTVTTTGNNGNKTEMDSGGVKFTQNNTETGRITPWLYKDSVGRLSISYKDELRIEYNQDTNAVHMEMDDDSIGLYANGSPGASTLALFGGYSPSVDISTDTINIGSGYGTTYLRTDYIYVRDAYGNDNQGWTGTINGVSDGSGNHGDIDVVNGIITNWSEWY